MNYLFDNPQLLLCVGSFFGSAEECKKDWEQYQDGVLKG